jgi:hypothetical protein
MSLTAFHAAKRSAISATRGIKTLRQQTLTAFRHAFNKPLRLGTQRCGYSVSRPLAKQSQGSRGPEKDEEKPAQEKQEQHTFPLESEDDFYQPSDSLLENIFLLEDEMLAAQKTITDPDRLEREMAQLFAELEVCETWDRYKMSVRNGCKQSLKDKNLRVFGAATFRSARMMLRVPGRQRSYERRRLTLMFLLAALCLMYGDTMVSFVFLLLIHRSWKKFVKWAESRKAEKAAPADDFLTYLKSQGVEGQAEARTEKEDPKDVLDIMVEA